MSMLRLFQSLIGRSPKSDLPPFDFTRNRYRAKKEWPPNLSELTERQNFRFERKFKRRLRLKSIKPQWQKGVALVQWSAIGFVVVYGVLFHDFSNDPMNPRPGEQPFQRLRNWMWGLGGDFWTHTSAESQLQGQPRGRGVEAQMEEGVRTGGRKGPDNVH